MHTHRHSMTAHYYEFPVHPVYARSRSTYYYKKTSKRMADNARCRRFAIFACACAEGCAMRAGAISHRDNRNIADDDRAIIHRDTCPRGHAWIKKKKGMLRLLPPLSARRRRPRRYPCPLEPASEPADNANGPENSFSSLGLVVGSVRATREYFCRAFHM